MWRGVARGTDVAPPPQGANLHLRWEWGMRYGLTGGVDRSGCAQTHDATLLRSAHGHGAPEERELTRTWGAIFARDWCFQPPPSFDLRRHPLAHCPSMYPAVHALKIRSRLFLAKAPLLFTIVIVAIAAPRTNLRDMASTVAQTQEEGSQSGRRRPPWRWRLARNDHRCRHHWNIEHRKSAR